jgi:hypothetical protein
MWRQSMQTKAMAPSWQRAAADQKARERGLVHFADTHGEFAVANAPGAAYKLSTT